MDIGLKTKWLDALRSGKYTQTKMQLRDERGFCCLGVLCEVAGMEINKDGTEVVLEGKEVGYRPLQTILDDRPKIGELYSRNDRGVPFPEIADYIEANL